MILASIDKHKQVWGVEIHIYLPHPTKPQIRHMQTFSVVPQTEHGDLSGCCWQYRQTLTDKKYRKRELE